MSHIKSYAQELEKRIGHLEGEMAAIKSALAIVAIGLGAEATMFGPHPDRTQVVACLEVMPLLQAQIELERETLASMKEKAMQEWKDNAPRGPDTV